MFDAKTVVKKNLAFTGICILIFGLCVLGKQSFAQNRLAIHATQEEVNIWKQRSVSGPYLEDWKRIQSRANSFLASPHAETWAGNQVNACWEGAKVVAGQQSPNTLPGRARGDKLRDAGFVYLVTGNTTYRDQVRTTLLSQAAMAGTNFATVSRWCPTITYANDYEIANWLRKISYGYSYIRSSLSSSDQKTLDTWFRNAGNFWAEYIHTNIKKRFPNRLKDDYSSCAGGSTYCPGSNKGANYFGAGTSFYAFHNAFNNIASLEAAFVAAAGVIVNDAGLKAAAKRFAKEWLMFCVGPDGTVCDQHRWNDNGDPQRGFFYPGSALGSVITIADHLARDGDTELYTFSTTAGLYGYAGGPKTLLKAVHRYAAMVIGERNLGAGGVIAYASKTATSDPAKRIGPGTTYATDLVMLPAQLYYQDNLVKTAVRRTLPSNPSAGGYDPWGGDWGTYPALRFMFGQMEGLVKPYSGTHNTPLYPPMGLRIATK